MTKKHCKLVVLPCLDSEDMANARRRELRMPRELAANLGASAVAAIHSGHYPSSAGRKVDWSHLVEAACSAKRSIAPDAPLPTAGDAPFSETRVQVANETTLQASLRLVEAGLRPLALNFANGFYPGGGFLNGARAQEETLCRSSALYQTLVGDPMYDRHHELRHPGASDWAIYSPDIPVFRKDDGTAADSLWLLCFLSCAAPVAYEVGLRTSGHLLQKRIHRVLAIARAFGYTALVLGAWGCGAFGNDPHRTATDFRQALKDDFSGAFSDVVFAITDWSPGRKFLGPFRDVFGE